MKKVIILFGGNSPEHEVSIITGLQVVEKIDRSIFEVYAIKVNKEGKFEYYRNLKNRGDYKTIKPQSITWGGDESGAFFQVSGLFEEKIYIDAAFLALHGGNGESGQIQGFLESLGIAYTSAGVESSSISMNKALTKDILLAASIKCLRGTSVQSSDIQDNVDEVIKKLKIMPPVIIKPVHLGSSIGIRVAKTLIELKKYLLEARFVDTEILIEKLLTDFSEYNVSVRKINGELQASEVEHPVSHDEILSFADKYQRGTKKTGGMASLNRELPAKISKDLSEKLKSTAIAVFKAVRSKGMIRVDFMVKSGEIFVTEVNPIPGSMAYYLWEASGISFKDQITDLINEAIRERALSANIHIDYKSDIVEKFINNKDR